jgi:ATP-dependent Clp protease, protease subunit
MNEEMKLMPMLQPNKLFVTENRDHTLYEYYLVGTIGDPEEYIDLCNALRAARPEDRFVLRFNSGGGQVRTGNQILNALHECEATTIGFIEHDCGSMCTFLFLACNTWGVSKYAEWFSHTVSGGNFGKECETFEASQFLRRQTHKRIKEEYAGFLTDQEIDKILTGTDIYLDSDEIMERLNTYAEARDSQGCDDPECSDCNQDSMPSIDSIIEDAVASGVEKAVGNLLKKYELVERPKKPSRAKKPELSENPQLG